LSVRGVASPLRPLRPLRPLGVGGECVSPKSKTDKAGKHDFVATITDPDTGDVIAQGECGEDGETSSVTAAKAKGLAFTGADHLDTYVGIGLATLVLGLIAKTVSVIRRRRSVPAGDPATTAITTMDEV
jgi:hypothetical protein